MPSSMSTDAKQYETMVNKMRSDIIIVKFAALCVEIFGQRSSRQQNEWDFMRACSGDS